jgi:hypothetical protein
MIRDCLIFPLFVTRSRQCLTRQTVAQIEGAVLEAEISSGGPGLVKSGASDLWLRNAAGVVLHLKGTQEGMTLSLGREEILTEMI